MFERRPRSPHSDPIAVGCKRICVDTNYYETYNLPHVKLVSVKSNAITDVGGPSGLITLADGTTYGPFDVIVSATGFDALTGAIMRINITGRDGLTIKEAWEAGPVNYLGLFVRGFHNMFIVTGPGSPGVLTCMINSIEHHSEWILSRCILDMERDGVARIEATQEAQDGWVGHVNAVADGTLFRSCASWHLGANVAGKPRVFMPLIGLPDYVVRCAEVQENGYKCLELTAA
ncbi:cyclohexanone monooxygenase [Hyaloraphidium curvatum]|nr:cyclohexanone monooxygenase [Hyaloraphidium curvatum]